MKWSVEQIAVLKASITAGDNVYLRLNEGAAPEKVVRIEEDELDVRVYFGSGSTYVRLSNMLDDDDLPALDRFFIMHPLPWKTQGIGRPKNLLASCKSAP